MKKYRQGWDSNPRTETGMGFEPTHGDRIGLAVQRLNHSATLSQCSAVRGLCDLSCNVTFLIAFANNNFFGIFDCRLHMKNYRQG